MNQRVTFFLVAAAICSALVPLADAKHRPVPIGLAGVYLVLAILTWLDARSR